MLVKRIIIFLILALVVSFLWLADRYYYEEANLEKLFYTALSISVTYLIFKLFLEGPIARRIRESKTRYTFRKTNQILFFGYNFFYSSKNLGCRSASALGGLWIYRRRSCYFSTGCF